jgi:hypothetical protein
MAERWGQKNGRQNDEDKIRDRDMKTGQSVGPALSVNKVE